MITDEELNALVELERKASPGPWIAWSLPGQTTQGDDFGGVVGLPLISRDDMIGFKPADAAFLAAARNWLPGLLDEIARLRRVRTLLAGHIESVENTTWEKSERD